ncbi:PLDc N-terminal domain-containing protein [Marnyiella aurantia]|uniref:PLDc N-terminal domain-containing protein n=2 Tax=Marnyiella aurantia TaxID=2758037 RepID=A0A7D7QTY6_9FLAO|nr:PLDc N-terminal domain-containing protein [Marnyiella aurantia]QMS98547.1 PLDc N-terminal domain-containing protein [Marnyiella aurantia]
MLHNEKENRLLWHLIVCFFPIFGPLIYFLYRSLRRKITIAKEVRLLI